MSTSMERTRQQRCRETSIHGVRRKQSHLHALLRRSLLFKAQMPKVDAITEDSPQSAVQRTRLHHGTTLLRTLIGRSSVRIVIPCHAMLPPMRWPGLRLNGTRQHSTILDGIMRSTETRTTLRGLWGRASIFAAPIKNELGCFAHQNSIEPCLGGIHGSSCQELHSPPRVTVFGTRAML